MSTEENDSSESDDKEESEEESDDDKFEDPSLQKAKDFQKFSSDPPKLPGTEILTVEPKLMMLATKVLESLLNPKLTDSIIESVNKSIELDLENKKSKLNYLKYDTNFKNKHNEMIINAIHNESNEHQPTVIITPNNDDKDDVTEDVIEKDDKEKQEGGSYPFFTEEECSFF